jgi:hypothetical protein
MSPEMEASDASTTLGRTRNHLFRAAQRAGPPRWGKIKCLTRMAGDIIRGTGLTGSPMAFFLAMQAIITLQVSDSVSQTQQHWTFIPHPPLLQMATWKGQNIPVYTNDSELVGDHSIGYMTPTFSSYTFTGQSTLVPLCLDSLQWCFPTVPTWRSALLWNGTHYVDKKLEFLGFNATEQYNATHWLHFPKCHTKQTQHHPGKEAPWTQCLFPHSSFFNLSVATVVYWSRNASQETNVTGYWTTPW